MNGLQPGNQKLTFELTILIQIVILTSKAGLNSSFKLEKNITWILKTMWKHWMLYEINSMN